MNNSNSLVIGLLMAVIFCIALFAWISRKSELSDGTGIQLAVIPGNTTVLSGTTPHDMGGDISEQLRNMQRLPDTGWTAIQIQDDFLENVTNKAKTINTFSVLQILRTEGTSSSEKTNGVDMSWRADCVRPDKMHVSQSLWDAERQNYALDEWITIGKDLLVNFGLWGKMQDDETIKERSEINNSLLPENILSEFLKLEIIYIGLLDAEGVSYIFLQTTMQKDQDAGVMAQIWVDKNSLLIKKHRLAVYENNKFVGEQITTFIQHTRDLSITGPEWLNLDSTNTIINDKVCVVEHW